ncbi:Uncharacterised protein [Candidatus Venteria ishoeyi]|uniref:Beta-mannosidase n=2 Tax=Candidatus Venteria ishoeyi TaxID=1899563 RepID=A0A1H6FEI5_9GAMM|nr:Uncharacterised protein [Candidatus Venteria ishoeyi]SEH08566.1 Uncharacterised protein [Candidatus Venteria ishoeyi]
MSEYGFQGYPDFKTVQSFCSPKDVNLSSDAFKNHQKHPIGNETILEYMEREYPISDSIFEFTYLSQILQASGIQTAIEAHRRAKPHCMGTLYWQLNDCWPVVSWSSIDYYGRWKALHYKTRDLYKNFMISVDQQDSMLQVYVVSDSTQNIEANISVDLIDFYGKTIFTDSIKLNIKENSSQIFASYNLKELLPDSMLNSSLLQIKLNDKEKELAQRIHYFDLPKNLILPSPKINIEVEEIETGYSLEINSTSLVKNLYLYIENEECHSSDNYFDLLPGQAKVVSLKTSKSTSGLKNQIKYLSLADIPKL